MSSSDILDPAALISLLPTLLPSSSKSLSSPQDAISALIHTALTVLAFRLISVDDDESASLTANLLPPQWNKGGPGHYTFKYKHDQSSLDFVIKISKLGPRTVVNAIAFQVSTHSLVTDVNLSANNRATRLPLWTFLLMTLHRHLSIHMTLMQQTVNLLCTGSYHPPVLKI